MTVQGEALPMSQVDELGVLAIGTIGPLPRIENNEITEAEVDAFVEGLQSGEFHEAVGDELRLNAAGGTYSLAAADALTTSRFRKPGENAAQHATSLFTWLQENKNDAAGRAIIPGACIDGRPVVPGTPTIDSVVGGHEDCGAQNKLGPILEFLADNGDALRAATVANGIEVTDVSHDLIMQNVVGLIAENYAGNGQDIRNATVTVAGPHSVVPLVGKHKEVVAVRNNDPTRTLNRSKLAERYGDQLEAFNVDAGAFPAAAEAISLTPEEAAAKVVALEYFNLSAAFVLGDKSLLVTSHQ